MKREEYVNLIKEIERHRTLYYIENTQEISDFEFDQLMLKAKAVEKEHPEWKEDSSPTSTVGGAAKRQAGVTIKHNVPMLSISDVFSIDDVLAWTKEVRNVHPDATFCVEEKIDGLSMTIRYTNGILSLAETRGDGYEGEDVTANALVIPDIPSTIAFKKENPPYLEIRGEVYMTEDTLNKINEKQELLGKKTFANVRNCAAGTLRQLDSKIVQERGLNFFAFNVQDGPITYKTSHSKGLDLLKELNIPVVYSVKCKTDEEIIAHINRIGERRGALPYAIDGAVIKIEQIEYRKDISTSSNYSPGHIAYKYPPEEKETVLRDIEFSVGRTGKVTPTAIFDELNLCGTRVTRATLHNQDYIDSLDLYENDTITVFKSGEIIPAVKAVIKDKRISDKKVMFPKYCPACGSKLQRFEEESDYKCTNPTCSAQIERNLIYFASRDAMNIKGLGDKLICDLVNQGYIKTVADIYNLSTCREELIEKGLLGKEKNTDKVLEAIEVSKSNDAILLLTGLGIPFVGKGAAKKIMNYFGSIQNVMQASADNLVAVEDIGNITAKCIVSYFQNEHVRQIIKLLTAHGVNMEHKTASTGNKLSGLTFVITGTLPSMDRKDIASMIEQNGGKVSGSVSKKTDYLIAGENAGSKLAKANELGIKTITETEFLKMLSIS